MEQAASHNDIYDEDYYKRYTDEVAKSAIVIVDSIEAAIAPKTVIDVGCGSGEILARFVATASRCAGSIIPTPPLRCAATGDSR
jgi:ubiquinone/menaquinone biosynthesis C-methylase UbiE